MGLSVDATAETLMRQAGYTAEEYMKIAVESIDDLFGVGHARRNPELIAAFIQTAACDYKAALDLAGFQKIAEAIREFQDYRNDISEKE